MSSRRSSRRKTPTKSYAEPSINDIPNAPDDDDEDDDDDDDDEVDNYKDVKEEDASLKSEQEPSDKDSDSESSSIIQIKPTPKRKRTRGRPPGSQTKKKTPQSGSGSGSGSGKKERDYGPIEERTCPFCKKIFSIVTGLAYHIEHRVCQKPQKRVSKDAIGTIPFPILEPGQKFVTPFGVVQIIKDDRAGEDYGKTKLGVEVKELRKKYYRKKERVDNRKNKVYLFVAKKSRKRRNSLLQRYLKNGKRPSGGIGGGGAGAAAAQYAKGVFQEYYPHATPSQIFSGTYKKSAEVPLLPVEQASDLGPDPAVPADSYPDRIVECVLIKDDRKTIVDMDNADEGRLSQVEVAIALVEKTQRKLKKGQAKMKTAADGTKAMHESGLKLFINRHLLIEEYNPGLPVYSCETCGKEFTSRVGCKGHIAQNTCINDGESFLEYRESRLEEVEEALEIDLKPPPWLLPPIKVAPGEKKRKRCKKMPGWIVFDPELSTIYPTVRFRTLRML